MLYVYGLHYLAWDAHDERFGGILVVSLTGAGAGSCTPFSKFRTICLAAEVYVVSAIARARRKRTWIVLKAFSKTVPSLQA